MGVFYHLAFGIPKNLDKAIEYLSKSARVGNGQSCYQLALIYCEDSPHRDFKKAYHFYEKALLAGVSMFDGFQALFVEHFDELSPIFLAKKKPSALIDKTNKQEVTNLHEAYVNDMKNTFSSAMSKDRLYLRPVGFM